MKPLLSVSEVSLQIAGRQLVDSLSLDIYPQQRWAVLGPNGAGKTTLLKSLAGLSQSKSGTIRLNQRELTSYKRRDIARQLGYLSENDTESFPLSVYDSVLSGSYSRFNRFTGPTGEHHAQCREALRFTHIENLSDRSLTGLSAGERRRVAIARLLVQQPRLALVDEPTNHLDLKQQFDMMELLNASFSKTGRGLLVILHDIRIATRYCSHVLMLYGDGRWQTGSVKDMISKSQLGALYQLSDHQVETLYGNGIAMKQ